MWIFMFHISSRCSWVYNDENMFIDYLSHVFGWGKFPIVTFHLLKLAHSQSLFAVLLCQTIFPRIIAIPWLIASLEKLPPLDRNIENNRLPQIISHPHPSHHLLFLLSPSCQVEVESDPAKLISDDFFKLLTPRILTLKINQGTKFGTLTKIAHVKFINFDVIIFFYFMGW